MKSISNLNKFNRNEIAANLREGKFDKIPPEVLNALAELIEVKPRGRKPTGISPETVKEYNRALGLIDDMRNNNRKISLDTIFHKVKEKNKLPFGVETLRRIWSLRKNRLLDDRLDYITGLYHEIGMKYIYDRVRKYVNNSDYYAFNEFIKLLRGAEYEISYPYINSLAASDYDTSEVSECKSELDFFILIATSYANDRLSS